MRSMEGVVRPSESVLEFKAASAESGLSYNVENKKFTDTLAQFVVPSESKTLLPKGTLYVSPGNRSIVLVEPPSVKVVNYVSRKGIVATFALPMPYLVYGFNKTNFGNEYNYVVSHLRALTVNEDFFEQQRGSPTAIDGQGLHVLPLPNLYYRNGGVCTHDPEFESEPRTLTESVNLAIAEFWGSTFNPEVGDFLAKTDLSVGATAYHQLAIKDGESNDVQGMMMPWAFLSRDYNDLYFYRYWEALLDVGTRDPAILATNFVKMVTPQTEKLGTFARTAVRFNEELGSGGGEPRDPSRVSSSSISGPQGRSRRNPFDSYDLLYQNILAAASHSS